MNAPHVDRIAALSYLSQRVMHGLGAQADLLAEAPPPKTLLAHLQDMERAGYTIAAPYRAFPPSQIGFEDWRIPITRPDGIRFEIAFFFRLDSYCGHPTS